MISDRAKHLYETILSLLHVNWFRLFHCNNINQKATTNWRKQRLNLNCCIVSCMHVFVLDDVIIKPFNLRFEHLFIILNPVFNVDTAQPLNVQSPDELSTAFDSFFDCYSNQSCASESNAEVSLTEMHSNMYCGYWHFESQRKIGAFAQQLKLDDSVFPNKTKNVQLDVGLSQFIMLSSHVSSFFFSVKGLLAIKYNRIIFLLWL